MPARLLREGILDSDAVNSLTVDEEIFYRRLMSVVDDFGRFDGRVSVLRSRLYPLRLSTVREADISRWIAACVKAGLIALYETDGKHYILFHKLGSPRAKSSKYPAPPPELENLRASESGRAQVHSDAPYSGTSSYSGSGTDPPNGHPTRRKPKPSREERARQALKHGE